MEAIKRPYEIIPECKKIRHASLDSEYYRADVMEYLRSKRTSFSISADKEVVWEYNDRVQIENVIKYGVYAEWGFWG